MGLVQSERRHIVGHRTYFLEACVIGLLLVFGCSKHEASTCSTAEQRSILALFQNTQRVVVKQSGTVVGTLAITDRESKEFRIDVIIRGPEGGELYSVSADSLEQGYAAYAPVEKDGQPLFRSFQKKSAEAKK